MKRITVLFVVITLLVGGVGVIGFNGGMTALPGTGVGDTTDQHLLQETVAFGPPAIGSSDGYATVTLEGCAALHSPGKPVVPVLRREFVFPLGTRITDVEVTLSGEQEVAVEKTVAPGYVAVPPDMTTRAVERRADQQVYGTDALYPGASHVYHTAGGIRNGERVTLLSIAVYPVRYNPVAGTARAAGEAEITVRYQPPEQPLATADAYDLLVICPRAWEELLTPLAEHKESKGLATKVVCLECIAAGEYFPPQGRDDAEQMKYFIKNAVEEWGIKYVLLVGGRKPGIREEWLLPVRYVHVFWAEENRYLSDLYFADLYNADGSFSSWDTDDNDVFMEWRNMGRLQDEADLYPDVYLGRWACRNRAEVNIMVQKTIAYENGQGTKNVVLAGGDNFPQEGIEGEIVCDKVLSYLPGFEADKVYVSLGDVTSDAMKSGMNDGAMFIHMHGHGSPIYWSTHKENNFNEWEDGFKFYDIPFFFNEEYSISIIGGCHTAMFNMSMTNFPWAGTPAPEGSAWWFARKYNGGAIASLGYTAFPVATPGESGDLDGDGVNDPDCAESGYGYMQLQLIYGYGMEGLEHLGECWSYAVSSYTDHFKSPYERWHLHTIQSFVLLGDPSLKIGGY
ncbi:MAG: C25 family cysteine peptidase [Candidatus Thermoplasmatota archaeon]|nr:C25 family cysteine peptidase [Candidatus Thermoplasmatota archaeon]